MGIEAIGPSGRPPGARASGPKLTEFMRSRATEWLARPENRSRFGPDPFHSSELAFPGMSRPEDRPKRTPWMFVHGNISNAAHMGAVAAVLARHEDLSLNSLYAYSYGENPDWETTSAARKLLLANKQGMSPELVAAVRAQLEFTLEVTGAQKLRVLTHSLGGPLAVLAIQGSSALGPPLGEKIDVLILVGGGFRGLGSSLAAPFLGSTNPVDGFFPGVPSLNPLDWARAYPDNLAAVMTGDLSRLNIPVMFRSQALESMLNGPRPAGHILTVGSDQDEVVSGMLGTPLGTTLYGKDTRDFPGQDAKLVLKGVSHTGLLGEPTAHQIAALLRDQGLSQRPKASSTTKDGWEPPG